MSGITDRIIALAREGLDDSDGPVMVPLGEVLGIVENAIPVEIDPEMFEAPDSEHEREILAVVSTAYNLLADTAAKFAACELRAGLEAQGVALFGDDEVFSSGGKISSYRDLAERNPDRVEEISTTFLALISESTVAANLGAILFMRGDSE